MGLAEYKRKRHFSRTPEPAGQTASSKGQSFVVQKHDASRLHYDFRLELDGVLKSWAVPKGPSLDPAQKRLAVHVEDHPVDYGDFEGIIPEGEYGGGTVMLWDRGRWEPVGDPHTGYRQGKLKFKLHGQKLRGGWMLVRTGRSRAEGGKDWLLFKERDEEAQPLEEGDILEEAPLSVASGRDLDVIAHSRERVWGSNRSTNGKHRSIAKKKATPAKQRRRLVSVAGIEGAAKQPLPKAAEAQLATLTERAPVGDEWLHEIKFDGYRMLCRIDGERVEFISRNQQKWTSRLGPLVEAVKQLPVKQALLDGEVVAMQADGTSDFQALQNAFSEGRLQDLRYYLFDLLYLDGYSLAEAPLEERKRVLADVLAAKPGRLIQLSEHVEGKGTEFLRQACKLHLEGIISKRRDRPYRGGRGYDWLKIKCMKKEEFVIGGYTEPSGSRVGFGALLVGYHDKSGELVYSGKVGTGFDSQTLRSLLEQLVSLERADSPFVDLPRKVGPARKAHWVEPKLVAQIAYGNRTRDGRLRHPSFQGLREDKPADEVTEEKALSLEKAVERSKTTGAGRRRSSTKSGTNKMTRKRASETPSRNGKQPAGYDARQQEFHGVRLTSPEKVLYPEQEITKLELANYYRDIADWILPHIAHRPLVLVRCPEGRGKECFYQKHPGPGTPDTLRQIPIREKHKAENYVVVDDVSGLISLAQVGALEIHAWGSREDKLEQPDRLVFDLDPDPLVAWDGVVAGARQVRAFLEELGLESFVKTTGGKGLHLVVPIERRHEWDEAKAFCKLVAETIVSADPAHYTAKMSKAARTGKIFIDYLRNGRGATAIVPYSTRARPGATVSAPLTWKELSPRIGSDKFTIRNLLRRLASLKKDPWAGIEKVRQSLSTPLKKLQELGIT